MSKNKIKNKALELFAKRGYEGVSIRDIAKEVELTASAIYSHFKSKEQLYLEILDFCITDFEKGVKETIKEHEDEENEQILYSVYIYFI